ncbi:hypothetical protein MCHUDSM44219_04719 [Mycolicibacterium chubuense]|uniref:Uncharacterized protein n=1 Tax=Mycolicibacterium chubuense TaxID=1800 RepID=A0A0J6VU58_MYCCU|nr:hypothetical protein MCHUDSM44219_04719 [Mycolicibacterium chubuense]
MRQPEPVEPVEQLPPRPGRHRVLARDERVHRRHVRRGVDQRAQGREVVVAHLGHPEQRDHRHHREPQCDRQPGGGHVGRGRRTARPRPTEIRLVQDDQSRDRPALEHRPLLVGEPLGKHHDIDLGGNPGRHDRHARGGQRRRHRVTADPAAAPHGYADGHTQAPLDGGHTRICGQGAAPGQHIRHTRHLSPSLSLTEIVASAPTCWTHEFRGGRSAYQPKATVGYQSVTRCGR